MGTLMSFEDIEAWQKARALTRRIYEVSNTAPFSRDYGLRDQIRRASVSVMSNVAEGYERGGTREFLQFLSVAGVSVGEVRSQLYAALDQQYVSREVFDELSGLAQEISRMLTGLMTYLRGSKPRGTTFRADR